MSKKLKEFEAYELRKDIVVLKSKSQIQEFYDCINKGDDVIVTFKKKSMVLAADEVITKFKSGEILLGANEILTPPSSKTKKTKKVNNK